MNTETYASPMLPNRGILVRHFNELRLATYVLALFALGHTLGAVVGTPRFGAESDSVVSAMKGIHVQAQGADCTWYGFYRGFGIFVSIFFVFSAFLSWHLGGMTAADRHRLVPVIWALFLAYVASAVVSWAYFFPVPLVFSIAAAALLGLASVRSVKRENSASSHSSREPS